MELLLKEKTDTMNETSLNTNQIDKLKVNVNK